ncbi:ATP-dependent DNA ligase [candidate division WWE3 bacterium]|uniref:Probable DNA ligase n=1 Tax=candidate division WWE3 bacterium TaxID=2053526 RepID=A0A3A4ZD34_UNCKA|nr:MAG: ATP-dependent DNA ligase [candidate division WWE3 bacterium]
MLFSDLAEYLEKLEKTSKRLEITSILSELILKLDPNEIDIGVYLTLGYLRASYENPKFNIADRMMLRILLQTYSSPNRHLTEIQINELYKKAGDLGNVAYELAPQKKESNLSLEEVHKKLQEIAEIEGSGSQDNKVVKTAALLKDLNRLSAKYVVRIILGTTRLGFTELTLADALALSTGDPKAGAAIERVYSLHPDIGYIAKMIRKSGIGGMKNIVVETGVPILSQKAQRVSGPEEAMEKMKNVWAEYKFDGTRVQLHMDRTKSITDTQLTQTPLFSSKKVGFLIKTFTRNLEETTHQYPDIVSAATEQIDAESVILDGEAIGFNRETGDFLPFQETMQRKRKHGISETALEIPLKYFVFDLLYLNGESLVDKTLRERKKLLREIVKDGETIIVDDYIESDSLEEIEEYFELAEEKGLEGLILKRPEDPYQAGARSFSWVKLKKADKKLLTDSVDCIVLGYYAGRGVRSKFGIGGFLIGVYDPETDTYKTISKVGTGLSDSDWAELKLMCDKVKIDKFPQNVDVPKNFMPDTIVSPKIVVEIGADEISESPSHSAGYALRFPRLLRFRKDKGATDATTTDEIKKMYKNQKRGHY